MPNFSQVDAHILALVLLTACAADGGRQCNVGADCVSGICQSNGLCLPPDDDGGVDGSTDAMPLDGGFDSSRDSDVPTDGASDSAVDSGTCAPNRDGVIERTEIPLRAGLRATFMGAVDVDFDTRGEMIDGVRTWDLSESFDGDRMVLVETRDPAGQWFESDFPGATYFTELSLEEDLLGVFEITDDALLLLGVVSPEDGFTATNLENDPGVTVLDFPLEEDKSWTTETTVSGLALGVISAYSEDYASEVDASGTMITPFGTFENVLRVRTELVRTVGLLVTRVVTLAYVSECFGTIATMRGRDGDDGAELTELAEVRRLAP